MDRVFAIFGAGLAMLAVMLGAFAAHGLESRLDASMLRIFETGARYHMYHALALFAVAWATARWGGKLTIVAGWLFVIGIFIFSGSLYLLAVTSQRWLGAITPIGGVCFILGWFLFALAAMLAPRRD